MLGTINNLASSLNIPVASNAAKQPEPLNTDSSALKDTGATSTDSVKPRAGRGTASVPTDDKEDKSSNLIKQLKKHIAMLQKQLQQQQQALQRIQSSQQSAEAKAAALSAAQAQVTSTTAALQEATAALLQALTVQGSSRSGSMVSTSA
ncbi:hypothetical protein SB766_12760 [Pseudomonas sp. SIMBA_077]